MIEATCPACKELPGVDEYIAPGNYRKFVLYCDNPKCGAVVSTKPCTSIAKAEDEWQRMFKKPISDQIVSVPAYLALYRKHQQLWRDHFILANSMRHANEALQKILVAQRASDQKRKESLRELEKRFNKDTRSR